MGLGVGAWDNWAVATVFGLFSLGLFVLLGIRLLFKKRGERLRTFTSALMATLAVFTAAMAAVYVVSSQPFWDARGRLNDSFTLVEGHLGVEAVQTNGYGPITIWDFNRPNSRVGCRIGRLIGEGDIVFAEAIGAERFETLGKGLESDGFEVFRFEDFANRERQGTTVVARVITAFRGTETLRVFVRLGEPSVVDVRADGDCPLSELVISRSIDSFTDTPGS